MWTAIPNQRFTPEASAASDRRQEDELPSRIVYILTAAVAAGAALAQVRAPEEFEVATVRLNKANDRIVTIDVGPGARFAARGYTLVLLIQRAYGVMDWNVTGGPSWIREDRFDIVAKADVQGNLKEEQLRPMLAKLLADRFKLELHRSSTQTFGYALEVAKSGLKMKTADGEEHRDTFRLTNTGMSGQGIGMRDFARFFGGKLGLIVVDGTSLAEFYDFKADWKVDTDRPAGDPAGVDYRELLREAAFQGLETQLGLKAVPKKVPVELLVIDHAQRPSALEN
jgi:uncharacterized protein (TIGR03435 family)